jgi:hypothetical protein
MWWRSSLNRRMRPYGPTWYIADRAKIMWHAPIEKVSIVNQRLRLPRRRYGHESDPYESRLVKVSIQYLNSQYGVRMKSCIHHKQPRACSLNPALKHVGFDPFLSIGQKWRGGLVKDVRNTWNWSQSTSLVLHVCISKNDNEHTS